MNEQDLKIKKYVNAVARRLQMPREVRGRVMSDFDSSISARLEAGESGDSILASLGSPKKAAAELNEQMKDYTYGKSPWRFVFLAGAILGLFTLAGKVLTMIMVYIITGNEAASLGIIGGADGPTAVFVTTPDGPAIETKIALTVLAVTLCLWGWYKANHIKRK